jgi:hypothetical protein
MFNTIGKFFSFGTKMIIHVWYVYGYQWISNTIFFVAILVIIIYNLYKCAHIPLIRQEVIYGSNLMWFQT